jgi:hypothetical protein
MGLEGNLNWWHELPQLIQRQTGHIEDLCRAGLKIDEPSRSHGGDLLSVEAKNITNRDELY